MKTKFRNWATTCLAVASTSVVSLAPLLLLLPTQAAYGSDYMPETWPVDGAGYDFERLEIRFLAGQDGWLSEPALGEAVVRDDVSAVNGTRVTQPDLGVASGFPGYFTRVNDAAFGFFLVSALQLTIQFDTTGAADTAFGLGTDVNEDGLLDRSTSELGPTFGLSRDTNLEVAQFAIYPSGFAAPLMTSLTSGNDPADWYRLQLRIDLVSGTGSLYFLNLSAGDTVFQPAPGLQDVDLRLDLLQLGARPETWNAMWLAMQADGRQSTPKVDNLIRTGLYPADVDGNDIADALTDGLLILRWLFGFSGASLIDDAVADDCVRCTAPEIEAYLEQIDAMLDIDGNGVSDALTDGLLMIRYLFGLRGDSLIRDAVAQDCTRCDAAAIEAYCATLVP